MPPFSHSLRAYLQFRTTITRESRLVSFTLASFSSCDEKEEAEEAGVLAAGEAS
jgi:hypothetical protein